MAQFDVFAHEVHIWRTRAENVTRHFAPFLDLIEGHNEAGPSKVMEPEPTNPTNILGRVGRAVDNFHGFMHSSMEHAVRRALGILRSHYPFIDVNRVEEG